MSINPLQFRIIVLQPTLLQMEALAGIPHTPFSEDLLLATAAQETHLGEYIIQERGPALGIYQMEPATIADLFDNYMGGRMAHWQPILDKFKAPGAYNDLTQIPWNMAYATVLARIDYFRVREALPNLSKDGLWYYYKKYWNTNAGAATSDQFLANLNKYTDIDLS